MGIGKKTNIILFNTFVSMGDLQIVVYIILVMIFIIARVMKAKKKAALPSQSLPRNTRDISPTAPVEQPKPFSTSQDPRKMTFEDLLKEFTEFNEKQPEVITEQPITTQPVKTFHEDKTFRETQPYEDSNPYENTSPYESTASYEATPVYEPAYTPDKPASYESLKSYDDSPVTSKKVTVADTKPIDENKSRFRQYATIKGQDVHNASRFRKLLRNSITVKDAVIMKEILDRKYF